MGTGACAASCVLENEDLAQLVDTNDEWIRERTGIKRRHIADGETVSSLAADAAKKALENAGISADQIGLIIVSTMSPESIMPCTACVVQKKLKAKNAFCFDLNAACSGFVAAFVTARSYIAAGIVRYALVIGSEVLSNVVDWTDRGSCILFGDGAGAVVLGPSDEKQTSPVIHSDGEQSEALTLMNRYDSCGPLQAVLAKKKEEKAGTKQEADTDVPSDEQKKAYYLGMDGRAVFQFAVRRVPQVISELLEKNKLEKSDISFYILHQANRRIVEAAAKRLEEPIEKFPINLDEYGNTSSASVAILLDEMNRKGMLHKGDKLVLAGFGAGMTWGADVITWN